MKLYMVKVGDRIIVKQPCENKLFPAYEQQPYTVTQKRGSDIIVERDNGRKLERNSSFAKRHVSPEDVPEISASD